MDGWFDEWNGWVYGYMDGWDDGWMERQIYGWTVGQIPTWQGHPLRPIAPTPVHSISYQNPSLEVCLATDTLWFLTHSTFLSCQRWSHVNSCDIVMRGEFILSAPIRVSVAPAAAPAWQHLPAIMNCQHGSLAHLYRPFSCFSFSVTFLFHFFLIASTKLHNQC